MVMVMMMVVDEEKRKMQKKISKAQKKFIIRNKKMKSEAREWTSARVFLYMHAAEKFLKAGLAGGRDREHVRRAQKQHTIYMQFFINVRSPDFFFGSTSIFCHLGN